MSDLMRVTLELSEENVIKLDSLAKRLWDGKRNDAINEVLQQLDGVNLEGEQWKIKDILQFPEIDLTRLRYDSAGGIKTPFRRNFIKLPLRYRIRVYKLLLLLIKGRPLTPEQRYKGNFMGVAENLSLYYSSANSGYRNFYMNIKGKVGTYTCEQYLRGISQEFRLSDEVDSPIWVSRFERFIANRFLDNQKIIFDDIVEVLAVNPEVNHIQLSTRDFDRLFEFFLEKLDAYGLFEN